MKKVQQGFTLIELMIVVAIIGILAAIAIPAYQDYTTRAKITEGLGMAAAAKTSVSEYVVSRATWPADNTAAGITSPNTAYVSSVAVNGTQVTVIFNAANLGGVSAASNSLIFTGATDAAGTVTWTCTAGTLASKYRPANCR